MASNVLCQYPGTAIASLVNSQLMACWDWLIWPNISLWRAQEWRAAPSVLQPLNTLLAKQDKEVEAQMCRQISQQLLSVSNTALLGCPLMATLPQPFHKLGNGLSVQTAVASAILTHTYVPPPPPSPVYSHVHWGCWWGLRAAATRRQLLVD